MALFDYKSQLPSPKEEVDKAADREIHFCQLVLTKKK
jgi:hypothetical protein